MKLKKRITPMLAGTLAAVIAITSTASAHRYDYWGGKYIGKDGVNILFRISPSAETNLLNWNDVYSHGYDWNRISSNVDVTVAPSTVSLTGGMMVVGKYYDYALLGITIPYGSNGKPLESNGDYNYDTDWSYVEITMNTNPAYFNATSNPSTAARKTFVHEVGHALKLSHPKQSTSINGHEINGLPEAIMNQGYPETDGAISKSITEHDKSCLIAKWGY